MLQQIETLTPAFQVALAILLCLFAVVFVAMHNSALNNLRDPGFPVGVLLTVLLTSGFIFIGVPVIQRLQAEDRLGLTTNRDLIQNGWVPLVGCVLMALLFLCVWYVHGLSKRNTSGKDE